MPWFNEVQLALITVYVIVAVDVFGLTLIVPVIVTYARFLGASEAAVGYLYAVYSGMALLATFFVGKLSDRYGRRAVFLYCCVGAIASFVGSAFSTTFVQFAICRGISGLFTGTMGNAYAYIGDLVPEKDKPKYISYVTATLSTCFIVGPIIGGGFAAIDIRAPFYAAAGMAIVELLLIWFFVHDPKTIVSRNNGMYDALLGDEKDVESSAGTDNVSNAATSSTKDAHTDNTEDNTTSSALHGESDFAEILQDPFLLSPSQQTDSEDPGASSTAEHTRRSHHSHDGASALDSPRNVGLLVPTASSGDKSTANTEGNANSSDSEDTATKPASAQAGPRDISPWFNLPALLIGGLGTFLSTTTYCGMAILVPFLLMDPDFGIVSDSDDTDDISSHDSKKLSLVIGYLLTMLGTVQVLGMLLVFPRVNKRLGLMFTGAIGASIYGGSFCFLVLVRKLDYLYPVVIGLAVGYSLCRPVYPAFLSIVAHPDRRGDYQTMSTSFIQMAWIFAVLLTQFWSYSHAGAILYCGSASLLNALMMLGYGVYTYKTLHKEPSTAAVTK